MKMFPLARCAGVVGAIFFAATAFADSDAVKNKIQERHPEVTIKSIQASPVPGIYEVFANGQIFYATEDAAYVFVGANLIDDANKRNITLERLKAMTATDFGKLPLADAIEMKKGNGKYKFAVFSDPDCPHCKSLEHGMNIDGIKDYTAYIFMLPLPSHPDARWKAEAIWCASDRLAAWDDWMLREKLPEKKTCDNPIERNIALSKTLGVAGTPTIYLGDGTQATSLQDVVDAINFSDAAKSDLAK